MRFSITLVAVFLLMFNVPVSGQKDDIGSGRALLFDGADDYVDFGDIFDDVALPVSISAWIWVDPSKTGQTPIFASQDKLSLYDGFWMVVNPTHLFCGYGDGFGYNLPQYRREMSAPHNGIAGEWTHVCAVIKGATDMSLYINGVRVEATIPTGQTNNPMSSFHPDEVATSGTWTTNNATHWFKGMIDELRVWNIALSTTQIRDEMCRKLSGNEVGLIGYWTFNETAGNLVNDQSSEANDGMIVGATRVFSGAPIGDESIHEYGGLIVEKNWDDFSVKEITNSPSGIQLYRVNSPPSQGLGLPSSFKSYYGVFTVKKIGEPGFSLDVCGFEREDNSAPEWMQFANKSFIWRREIVMNQDQVLSVDLGDDIVQCDNGAVTILPVTQLPEGTIYQWNTGATSREITVDVSGVYRLRVSNGCGVGEDEIEVVFRDQSFDPSRIPNVITPNGDPLNQFFVVPLEFSDRLILQVFNRWGQKVYKNNDYKNDWDADGLPPGVYFYTLKSGCGGQVKGTVSVLK